jgi:hypothetical protein
MKINSDLGYQPVTFSELTDDEDFWKGCSSCVNYDILTRMNRKMCLCTGMVYDPKEAQQKKWDFVKKSKLYERWAKFRNTRLLKPLPQDTVKTILALFKIG